MTSSSSAMRAYAARAARRAVGSSEAYRTTRTAMPMCSSTYSRRTSWPRALPAHNAAASTTVTSCLSMPIVSKIVLLWLPLWLLQTPVAPYRDSIPRTLVSFDMVPVPAGTVTFDTPQGPRVVSVSSFWIGKTEVTWDEYDVWAFRL